MTSVKGGSTQLAPATFDDFTEPGIARNSKKPFETGMQVAAVRCRALTMTRIGATVTGATQIRKKLTGNVRNGRTQAAMTATAGTSGANQCGILEFFNEPRSEIS